MSIIASQAYVNSYLATPTTESSRRIGRPFGAAAGVRAAAPAGRNREGTLAESERWAELWDRAKELEKAAVSRRRSTHDYILERFKKLKYKTFGALARAVERLPPEAARLVRECDEETKSMLREATESRHESDRLLDEKRRSDQRKVLDPAVDPVPLGDHPKLRDCRSFPLRRSCNYGENEQARWERCPFMKYDNSKTIGDPRRWSCTAPE